MTGSIDITPIGILHTPFATKEECPIQFAYAKQAQGRIEIFPEYADGLETIEGFSHIFLLYRFDRAGEVILSRPTFLDDEPHGVFASRHPCRPNSIGMSIVRLISREDNVLTVEGVDMLDGTPLIDIKPYVKRFDSIPDATEGWIANTQWREKPSGRE